MADALRDHSQARSGDATRLRILNAAAALFAERGFEATTVRAIAFRAGVTDGALYYHFESKREILNALWDTARDIGRPSAVEHARSRQDLASQAEQRFDAWVDNVALLRVLFQQSLEGDELAIEFRQAVLDTYNAVMIPALRAIYGEIAPLVAEAQIHTITGLVVETMLRYGSAFRDVTDQPAFRNRLRRLIDQALPLPATASQA